MDLDEDQQEVVSYPDSTVIIAGPGSGKTRTLVAKAESLYKEGKDFICLTFTRAAAREMRNRMPGIQAQTIHSYCYREVGWSGGYESLLADQLESSHKEKYEWVLIDEVQDLTDPQLEVALGLVGGKIFAVGDPYQSIYGFGEALGREATDRLLDLGCRRFLLRNNYRSCPAIVSYLNRLYSRGLVSSGISTNGLTAVLTRTKKKVREVSEVLKEEGVGHTVRFSGSELSTAKEVVLGSEALRVMTCHCSKGLEFDRVVLYDWFPEPFWGEEKNLYYVSAARASEKFYEVDNPGNLLEALV